ncbi:SGNH hydrolase domain-containing protein [Aeromicrobium duanguangcaii]|uniref:SGNH hydrolase domain-containing protein n=1 Tax=Aeromicrobium duanguangcaii TaxID=2968086 RepID=UPI002017436A|nr:SGNH hydrolase domain-containing protein [Aeromicrobium duanguangcaii]MCL3838195.1 hypothetical protein [Aeromicrobium duanguangcaii]
MPAARIVRRATGAALVVLLGSALPAVAEKPRLSSIAAAESDFAPGTRACFNGSRSGQTRVLTCHYGRKGPRLLVIGDSHMRALSPAFRRLADQGKIRVTLIIRSRCGWSSRVVKNDTKWIRDDCQAWRKNVERYIRKQRNVRAIVTHHRASTMAGTYAQRGPDTVKSWRVALKRRIPVIALAGAANWKSAGPSPTQCLRKNRAPRQWSNCAAPERKVITFDWSVPSVKLARKQYGRRAAFRINLRAEHCPKRVCRVVTPRGQIMYRDHQHLTATYARSLTPLIESQLRATGVVFGP